MSDEHDPFADTSISVRKTVALSADQIKRAARLGSATLHEAGGRIGALPSSIKPTAASFRLAGPAFTVHCPPNDNLWIHRAIKAASPGDILVVYASGHYEAGYWGEVMSTAGMVARLGGLVIDAGVRDGALLEEVGFPVFSRAFQTRAGPGVGGETGMRYTGERRRRDDRQTNGARSRHTGRGVSPLKSMVRDSSATVVSGASRIPFRRSSQFRRFPWRCRSLTILEQAMAMRKREEDEVFPNAAGIDVGGSSHWAAVPKGAADEPVREFGAMTDDLNAMADWLLSCGVDTVALESTGVYWIPVYEVLERRGLVVWLVDARQMKYVPGRKSDVQDCQWLQRLMSLGLLRAAWRPGDEVCVVRAVVRQREVLLAEQADWVQRMQKALVQMNLQLTEVLTDVMGMTGQAIVRAIVAGERDPKVLARHRHGRVKASERDIERALTGNWREEHLFVLGQALAMFDSLAQRVLECDAKIEALLAPLGRHEVELSGPGKRRGKNTPQFDARTALARWAGVDLTRINGLAVTTVMTILSEIGPDLSRFANVKHFCSWLGLCPGTKVSGGKVLSARTRRSTNRVRQALKLAAMSLSRNDSALGAFYRRLCSRMDKPRANTAVAHKLARMVYFMLTRGEAFVDQGQQHYEEQQRQRSIDALRRRATALGFQITPAPQTP